MLKIAFMYFTFCLDFLLLASVMTVNFSIKLTVELYKFLISQMFGEKKDGDQRNVLYLSATPCMNLCFCWVSLFT